MRKVKSELYFTGLIFILPFIDTCQIVDLRSFTFDVDPQEVGLQVLNIFIKVFIANFFSR